MFSLMKSVTVHLQLAVWSATLWTPEKITNAKSMVPVLVSEQICHMHLQAIRVPTRCCENDTDVSRTLHFIKQ